MSGKIKITIFEDGHVQGEINGIKGKKCTNYIKILEELLDSKVVDSDYTPEYYELETQDINEDEKLTLKNN
ncbi:MULTISPECIES: DUF2997 domain-containing protein [Clostridium]|uniref:DUF2997 domain-containing protein n=1 Tax=Clostridium TaxID=1485 RepID=UPI000825CB8B|nr:MULTISPECIES: DUF2997 domain-containing protein [Clostridium]PJI07521.1 DUF2997 domain-containing protein [Clostridium sp. CT7]